MTTDIETVGSTDIEVLDALDFDSDHTCDYEDCPNEVTHTLVCPCGVGAEDVCAGHAAVFQKIINDREPMSITFNNTCGDVPMIYDCTVLPY